MNVKRKIAGVAGLAAVLSTVFAAVASPPPRPSSFYGSISGATGLEIPAGTIVSAWIGTTKLAEAPVFTADGAPSFSIDVPGDFAETTAVEGGQEGQVVAFKVGGAPAPQTAAWQSGTYRRLDLTAPTGPDVAVTIDDGVSSVFPEGTLTYTITVRNNGQQTASGIALTDTLPTTATTVESAGGGTVAGSALTWPAFELAAGASSTRTVTLKVRTGLTEGTEAIVNQVSVTNDGSHGLDPKLSNNTATDSDLLSVPPDFVLADADLTVTPAQPQAGQTVTVSVNVHNNGNHSGTALVAVYNGRPYSGPVVGSATVSLAIHETQVKTFQFLATAPVSLISAAVDPANEVAELDEGNNVARKFLVQVPDLAIGLDNVSLTPAAPRSGDSVDVGVTVRNAGRTTASNVAVKVFDGEPDRGAPVIFSGQIPSIPAGGNQAVRFTWTAAEGQHRLNAVADPDDAILEMSETNNTAVREVTVPRAAGPDLTVSQVDVSALQQPAQTLVADGTVRAVIANGGDAPASSFVVRLFEDRDGDSTFSMGDRELARQTIASGLAAGATAEASLAVHAGLEFQRPLLWVEADAAQEVVEKREDNNLSACTGVCDSLGASSILPVVEEWSLSGMEVETAPVVVQLTDDNGDGLIDSRDIPDVAFHTEDSQGAAVMARSGADGSKIWRFTTPSISGRLANLAAADLDGDGVAEIIASRSDRKLMAIDHNGQAVWTSAALEMPGSDWAGGPVVGDLTGDGVPEIVVGRTVLSSSGTVLATGTANRGESYNYYGPLGVPVSPGVDAYHPAIADVDLDGRNELVAGDALYRMVNGSLTLVWDKTVPDNLMRDGYVAVGNLDGDPQAEIVYVSSGFVMVLNHDGSTARAQKRVIPLSPVVQPTMWAGPPTIANLAGDATPEILIAGDTELVALRADLSYLWRRPIDELAGQTAATVFDLDGDGKAEVMYLDQSNFYILNGQDGSVIYQRPNISKTATEYPVVADVDNDGQAEILVPSNTGFDGNTSTQGLHVLGNPAWRGTRPIWNEHSYHVTNVQLDGTVPAVETPPWQGDNTWRANQSLAPVVHHKPNATIGLPRVAPPATQGAEITLRVGNGGLGVLPAGTQVTAYLGSPAQNVVAGQTATSRALRPGEWEDVVLVWQQPGPAGAAATAVVDPQSKVAECDEADNSVAFTMTETILPDLRIPASGVTVSSPAKAGQKLTVTVKVENIGSVTAAAAPAGAKLRLYLGSPSLGVRAGEAVLPSVAPGASVNVAVTWDTLGLAGSQQVVAVADDDSEIVETNEANNAGSVDVALTAPTKPDLALESLTILPSSTTVGTPVTLRAEVTNRGINLASGFAVAFRVNNAEVNRATSTEPLAAGARRTVEFVLSTLTLSGRLQIDAVADPANAVAEENEGNNTQTGTLDLAGTGLTAAIRTERVSYASNDTASLTVTAQNSGAARQAVLRVTVQDPAGSVVAALAEQTLTLATGTTTFPFTWSTGVTPAGAYAAVAELAVGGTVVSRGSSPFTIAGDRSASAQLFSDRDQYAANGSASFTGRLRNTGVNQALTNLQARLFVESPAGAAVFSVTKAIASLAPGAEEPLNGVWPVANAAPGTYTGKLELREVGTNNLLAFAAVPVKVLDSADNGSGLTGELTVSPDPVGAGAPLLARFSARDGGNAAMPALRLRLRLIRMSDEAVVDTAEIPWPLALNEQRSGSVAFDTLSLQEGEYRATLDGLLPGGELGLASAPFHAVRGVSVADATVTEGDAGTAQAVFRLSLSSPAPSAVTVEYHTQDGTAVAGEDYEVASGTFTFQPGETEGTVAVTVHGDTVAESEEVFLLELANPSGVQLGDAQALGVIADEEGCSSPSLLANGDAEEGAVDSDLPGWTRSAGSDWRRRFGDPVPLAGLASFASAGIGSQGSQAELTQDVDLSPYAQRIDGVGQELLFEAFVQTLDEEVSDAARVIVEYRDATKATVLASFDSGDIASEGVWRPVVDARTVPAGTRWARIRLIGKKNSAAGIDVFFDRVALRSLGVPTLFAEDVTVNEGNTGTTPARFTLRLSCTRPDPIAVGYATANGTATAGTDYDAASGTLSFSGGTLQKTVDVAVRGDAVDEADETFTLNLTAGSDAVVLTPRRTGTIQDDDGPVTLSVSDAYVDEGDSGSAELRFTVSLSSISGKTVTVGYTTVAGTAAAGKDFTATSGTLTFAPGADSREVAVPVLGDRIDEADEMLTLQLSAPVNAALGDAQGAGTILDNDESQISIADAAVLEGNGEAVSAVFPVTLSLVNSRDVRVSYVTVNGTAVAGTDYQAVSGVLTIPAGSLSGTIQVPILGNRTEQLNRTFLVRLTAPEQASLLDPEAVGTIRDDDGVLISINDATVKEGDGGTVTAQLTVTVQNGGTKTVTVNAATVDGTAKAGTDYVALNTTLTFAPGVAQKTVVVTLVPDLVEEALTETFTVHLSTPSTGTLQKVDGTVTVTDDDGWAVNGVASTTTLPGCIFLTQSGTGTAWRKTQLDLSKSFDQTWEVFLGYNDSGADGLVYTLQRNGLTAQGNFGAGIGYAGGITPSVGVEVDTWQNTWDPAADHVAINLNGAIDHTGAAAVPASAVSDNVEDGQKHLLRVVWNAASKDMDVHFDGSERIFSTRDLVGQIFGGNPSVFYGFTSSTGGAENLHYFCPTGTCFDPSAPALVSVGDARVQEGSSGTTSLVFPVTLSCPRATAVQVSVQTADGTAKAGSDYTAVATTLTFQPGETAKEVAVPVNPDTAVEPTEDMRLVLSNPVNGELRYAEGVGTIVTDDTYVATTALKLVEGTGSNLPETFLEINLAGPVDVPVAVSWQTQDGTAKAGSDYTAASGTLTFAARETRKTILVRTAGDSVVEGDESFQIVFSNPVNVPLPAPVPVTLQDDDECAVQNLLRNGGAEEGLTGWTLISGNWGPNSFFTPHTGASYFFSGFPAGTVELRQDVDVRGYQQLIQQGLRFRTEAFTMTSGADTSRLLVEYRDAANQTVLGSFDSGELSTVQVWRRIADLRPAPQGTAWIRFRLFSTQNDGNGNDGFFDTMSLIPLGVPSISLADKTIVEGSSGQTTAVLPVVLNCPSPATVQVSYLTADGTAVADSDYVSSFGVLTIPAGQTQSAGIPVTVLGDTRTEGNETFAVRLASPVNVGLVKSEATVTITDDETAISIDDRTQLEGSSGLTPFSFTVRLAKAIDQAVTVDWSTASDTAAAGSDFVAAQGTVTFQPGETLKTVTVQVVADTLSEPDERFRLNLSNPVNAVVADGQADAVVQNDDLGISIADATVTEGNTGTVNAQFQVRLSAASTATVTVGYTVQAGTATAGIDFVLPTAGTLTFTPGQTFKTLPVQVKGDTEAEPSETFEVHLASPVNASIADGDALGVIADDDGCPSPNLLVNGGADDAMAGGEIPGWTEVTGTTWTQRTATPPVDGSASFQAGAVAEGELRQDVDVRVFAALIDAGIQRFLFQGYVQSDNEVPADRGRLTVEYLDDAKATVLSAFDSGEIDNVGSWQQAVDLRVVPPGTRWARVRLRVRRLSGSFSDAFFDGLSLRSLDVPVLQIEDKTITEGNVGTSITPVAVSLSCPLTAAVTVAFATADGTAVAGKDYQAAQGTLTFPAGSTAPVPVALTVLNDLKPEVDKAFVINLSSSSGPLLLRPQSRITLLDNDRTASITMSGTVRDFKPTHPDFEHFEPIPVVKGIVKPLLGADKKPVYRDGPVNLATTTTGKANFDQWYRDVSGVNLSGPLSITLQQDPARPNIYVFNEPFYPIDGQYFGNFNEHNFHFTYEVHSRFLYEGGEVLTVGGDDDLWIFINGGLAVDIGGVHFFTSETVNLDPIAANLGLVPGHVYDLDLFFAERKYNGSRLRVETTLPIGTANPGTVQLSAPAYEVTENGPVATVTVTRTGGSDGVITVPYNTSDGTAHAPGDYTPKTGTLTFLDRDDAPKTITIPIVDDAEYEPAETFQIALGQPGGGASLGAVTSATVTVLDNDAKPDLKAIKTAALQADNDHDGKPSPGDTVRYEIKITNPGNAKVTNVVLDDPIPAHTALVAGTVSTDRGTVASETPVQVNVGEIPAQGTATVHFDVAIENPLPADVDRLTNQGTVTSSEVPAVLTDDPVPAGANDPTVTLVTAAPDLVAEKTATLVVDADHDTKPSPGDTLEYAVTVRNRGNRAATNVTFSDPIPAHTALVAGSVTASQGTVTPGNPVQAALGTLAGGNATATVRFRVTIEKPLATGVQEITNQGEARATGLGPVLTDDPAADGPANPTVTHVTATPVLVVEKSATLAVDADADSAASPGDTLLYTIRVKSTGNTAATQVAVDDTIGEGMSLEAGSLQTSQGTVVTGQPVKVNLGELPSGTTATVTFRATLADPFPSTLQAVSNQATVTSQSLPPVPSDDPATTTAGDPTVTPVFVKPTVTIEDATVLEGAGSAQVTVRLSKASNREAKVDYTTAAGTATADDFKTTTGTLTFAPGETEKTINIPIVSDLLDETDETFTVSLSNPVLAALADAEAIVTITDDDEPPFVTVGSLTVAENAETATVPVTLSALSGLEVRVTYTTVDGTAKAGADYTAAANTLVFPAGTTTLNVPVTVLNDSLDENDETFSVALSNPVNATVGGAGTVTITDDDQTPAVSVSDVTVTEGDSGSVTAELTVSLAAVSGLDATVSFATADGTAQAGSDYQSANGTVTIPAGSTTTKVSVQVLGDTLDELGEAFKVVLSNPVNTTLGDAEGLVTITDDDEPPSITVGSLTVGEGNDTATVPVTLSAPSGLEVKVDYSTADATAKAGADYTAASGTLVFPAGTTSLNVPVTVLNDSLDENDETFSVALSHPVNATTGLAGTVTITDDDEAPAVSISDVTVTEGDSGSVTAELTVSLAQVSGLDASVSFATADVTAQAGSDYQAASGTVTIPAGSQTAKISVQILGDTLDELDETFKVALSNPVHTTLGDPEGLVTITDDDEPPSITVGSLTVGESSSTATVPVTLSAPSGLEVKVDYATVDATAKAGADYTAASGTLVFPAGTTSLTIPVTVLNDALDENDETFSIALANPVNATAGTAGTVTITDDDQAPAVSISDVSVTEGDSGTVTAELTVSLAAVSGLDATVSFATADGTAQVGSDYQSANGTVTIPAGSTTAKISVQVLGDALDELDETFKVALSSPVHTTLGDAEGLVTITDDDQAALSIGDARVTEGNTGTTDAVFTVRLSTASDREVKVDYVTKAGTATEGTDYEQTHGTVIFAAGETEKTVTVHVTGDTLLEAAEETYTVELSNAVNAQINHNSGQGGIVDDEQCPSPNLLAQTGWTVSGGELIQDVNLSAFASRIASGLSFSIEGQAQAGARMVVEYRNADGTAVLAAYDTGVLATAGHVSDVRTAPAGTSRIRVRLVSGGADAFSALALRALRVPFLSVADATVQEGGEAQFNISLSCPADREVTVAYATTGGTAQADTDFTTSNGNLTFAAGETSQTVSVATADDSLDEDDETFTLALSNPAEALLADALALGTITDDDETPSLTVGSPTVAENAGTADVVVTLSAPSGREVKVGYATADGTAKAGSDYTAASGTLVFPAGTTSLSVAVPVLNDALDEQDETFTVALASPVNSTVGGAGTVTITDDDQAPAVSISDVSVTEGDSGTVTAELTVSLAAVSGLDATVSFATADGTAQAGSDYQSANGTVTIPAGSTTAKISVQVLGDTLDELDETLKVVLSNPVHSTLGDSEGLVTVTDDDQAALSIGDARVTEGNSGTTDAVFTVRLSTASDREVKVDYVTKAGSATEGTDYEAAHGTLVFAAGETEKTVTVKVIGDTLLEAAAETYTVELSNAVNSQIEHNGGLGGIVDDEQCPGPNLLIPTGWNLVGGELVQDVDLSAFAARIAAGLSFSIEGQAQAGARMVVEYRNADGPAVLAAYDTGVLASTGHVSDVRTAPAGTGRIRVRLVTGGADAFSALSLRSLRVPFLSVADATVQEGSEAQFNVSLSCPADREVTVAYATTGGTAQADTDFTTSNGTLTFAAGETSQTVSVATVGDSLDEDDETLTLALSNPAEALLADALALGTITDDDETPSLTVGSPTVAENAGTADVVVTLSAPSGREVKVGYATADGTAKAGSDYTAASNTLLFPAGTTTATFPVQVAGDALHENNETFLVNLSNPVHATIADGHGTVTITDDDAAPAMSVSNVTVKEGDSGTVTAELTVTLPAVSGLDSSAPVATVDGTAKAGSDYVALSSTVTIPAGSLTAKVQVQVLGDRVDESDETFKVTVGAAEAVVTITDDDEAKIVADDIRVDEGNTGTKDALLPVRLTNPSDHTVTVGYATTAGTATEGTDYHRASGTLTFEPGEDRKTVKVQVIGDTLFETDETFHLDLSNAAGAPIQDGRGTATIVDDEACPSPNLLANAGAETSSATIGQIPGWTAVQGTQWQTRSTNPLPAEGKGYFWAGAGSRAELAQVVDVSAYADRIVTGTQRFAFDGFVRSANEQPSDTSRIVVEYLDANSVVLDAFDSGQIASPLEWRAVADTRTAPAGTARIRVRLIADRFQGTTLDAYFDGLSLRALRAPSLLIGDVVTYEGQSGTRTAAFPVTLTCPVEQSVSVAFTTVDGTAMAGSDYVATSGTLTFPAGSTQQSIPVGILGDRVDEGAETFQVRLSGQLPAADVALLDPVGVGTILSDDFCPRSPGYWKNHTSPWPLSAVVFGGRTYNATQMLAFLNYGASDTSMHLARQVVTTLLNLASGSSPSILPDLDAADAFLIDVPPGSNPTGAASDQATELKNRLEAYNNDVCKD
jgi:fibro-slime domain-containing protein/uncharacterized repeat protein (TIGR01451 family)